MRFVIEGHPIAGMRSLSPHGWVHGVPHKDKPHAERKQVTIKQESFDLAFAFELDLAFGLKD
ncbi:hypothetical protein A9R00_12945 [Oleispira antarctica]|uniref:Uncharacterized protein n=1 Tax=Oleispira antarctica TaxID=188908 RepID=A0A1Y5H947_OLEAN|nr:hypothetical protein A9R00_12945 [Oleispira antarctica]